MEKNSENYQQKNNDDAIVNFVEVSENLAKVITTRNGEKFELEMFVFTDENIKQIIKIKERLLINK